ncbi:MAG TPA: VWA domain-containing protein [Gammaproteobacteria bacterium]|nr:VWA domain-containing protein [Gammaproteobacteria bacterium]
MARREINVFSMSFLDAICCGFGAVILLFMIINANVDMKSATELKDLTSEARRMELKVDAGRKNLVTMKQDLAHLLEQWATIRGMRDDLLTELTTKQAEAATAEMDSKARQEAIEKLKAELTKIQTENDRLAAAAKEPVPGGTSIRGFVGDGNRQYLTGLKMGGKRVAILVDVSGSMLDRTLVNVIRRRNMPPAQQVQSPKWVQLVNTLDWLTTQIPEGTQVQVIAFNDEAKSLMPGTDGKWVTVTTSAELDDAVKNLRVTVPKGPTSLHAAFAAARALDPQPDNIYLLTDGLPTMGQIKPTREGATGRERVDHFQRAVRELPVGVPVNTILLAMEGDPKAAPLYWLLALHTGGSMLAPADDWP